MKKIVLIYIGFALAGGWRRVLTWDRWIGADAQLIIVTCVMCIVVVHLVLMLFVVGLMLVLVLGVLVLLLGGVLALWSMHRTWLECLVATIRMSLVLLFLLGLILVVATVTGDPATCSCADGTYCLACCGNHHPLNVVPLHGGHFCWTASIAHDASRISCVAQFGARVLSLRSLLLLAS